jgi:tRNA threonylcarbamoyladenosine modification (KEOPS) complex  Pcc1 subunit
MPVVKKATISLQKDDRYADVVVKSLHPETKRDIPRSHVKIREDKDLIYIEIQAEDTSSLRASLNSYLRWMKVTVDTYFKTQNNV